MISRFTAGGRARFAAAIIAWAVLQAAAVSARAEDATILKLGSFLAPNHYIEVNATKYFIDEATELAQGRLKFEYYPAQQIGKAADLLTLAQNGVIGIATVSVAYVSEKLPLSGEIEFFGLFDTSCAGTRAFAAALQPDKLLYQADYKPNNVHILFSVVLSPYKLFTRKPVRNLADFSGLKLRTAGGSMELMASKLGAVSVQMAAPDIYQSFSRGTLDACFSPISARGPMTCKRWPNTRPPGSASAPPALSG
ncbi:MAG: TRAP transporter substrate-binding protein DctP [Alphaproteobacteria bacterium]|nr:TRAP transporter substrate-binding protein DctP [Alphaproteobacteria bacterium]MBV9863163.1 TRAP transporter substrate-binding protein DctP [Alphaproteobacteria bacterium]